MVYSEQAKPAKAFKYANRLKVPFVAIIGGQEVSQGKISVKNMMTGVQQLTTVSEAIELIQHRGEG
jgi:histidyl-tRNA synthetase